MRNMYDVKKIWESISVKYELGEPESLQLFLNNVVEKELKEKGEFLIVTDDKHLHYLNEVYKEEADIVIIQNDNWELEINAYNKIVIILFEGNKNTIINKLEKKNKYVIDLYQEIRYKYNFIFMYPIYDHIKYKNYTYNTLNMCYKNFMQNQNEKNTEKLIKEFLYRKDFRSAFQYIDFYIKKDWYKTELYKQLKIEIEEMLLEIKDIISKRKHKDIIILWIDQLCFEDLEKCEYLYALAESSLFFERAYTVTPYTRPTIRYIFFKEELLQWLNKLCLKTRFKKYESSSLLHYVKKKGYKAILLVPDEGKYAWKTDSEFYESNSPSSLRLWELLEVLVEEKKPVFSIVDLLRETHEPFWNPFLEQNMGMQLFKTDYEDSNVQKRIEDSMVYLDNLVEFYSRYLCGNRMIKIYMSDHGKWNKITDRRYYEKAVHSVFFVNGNEINAGREKGMFPLSNLDMLLKRLLEGNNCNCFVELLKIQDTNIFNKDLIKLLQIRGEEKAEEISAAFSGVISQNEKYVKLDCGKEFYFLLPDEETNHISEKNYSKNIKKFRKIVRNDFKESIFIRIAKGVKELFIW